MKLLMCVSSRVLPAAFAMTCAGCGRVRAAGSGLPSANRITLLRDADGDGFAETQEADRAAVWEIDTRTGMHRVFASGLRNPVGVADSSVKAATPWAARSASRSIALVRCSWPMTWAIPSGA